eukprot:CAMPEP_0179272740 /NCGR_PEP_ID=MMETSP0797-20121207/32656_1 /TAXON_ID=47934 /ORGANISM="Dinophysis acuminata, Strain DAEP01" /LENGTH=38 /DNA_ID= /DNA_START= /DNA_END= /DNA_ORIENTATION=
MVRAAAPSAREASLACPPPESGCGETSCGATGIFARVQ